MRTNRSKRNGNNIDTEIFAEAEDWKTVELRFLLFQCFENQCYDRFRGRFLELEKMSVAKFFPKKKQTRHWI